MAHGDDDAARCQRLNERSGAWQFRRQCDQADCWRGPIGYQVSVRRLQMLGWVGAWLLGTQERAFQVEAERQATLETGRWPRLNHCPCRRHRLQGRRNNGRQKAGDAILGQLGGDFPDSRRFGRKIMAEAAVDL